jgi:hypothetical protein
VLAGPAGAAGSDGVARPPGAIDGRGYELVSQADKSSYQVSQALPISSDGTRVLYALLAGGAPGSTGGQGVLIATRTAAGWRSRNALPARAAMPASTYVLGGGTADLTHWIASAMEGIGSSDETPDVTVARLDDHGGQDLLHTFPSFFGVNGIPVVSSDDMRRVLVAVPRGADPSLPGYAAGLVTEGNTSVFDLGSDPPALVSAMPLSGLPPSCGLDGRSGAMEFPGNNVNAVSEHWISTDGARAFFATRGDVCSNPRQLYLRDLVAQTTRLLSGPPLAGDPDNGIERFLQATPDGSLAFFRTATSYDPSDDADGNASDRDIYRWTAATGALTCITCVVPNANVPLTSSNRFANAVIAEDGSHVYFPSAAQAAEAPAPGTATAPNLYVWRASDDSVHYIRQILLSSRGGLANVPYFGGQATPDGRVLIFLAKAPQNGDAYQYYRYDDGDRSLSCISCPPAGEPATDVPLSLTSAVAVFAVAPRARAVTDDGRMGFFATQDTLALADVNRAWDIYEWHDGVVRLITNGLTQYPGSTQPNPVGASADGHDFLFQDMTPLTWEAHDSSYQVYDVRIGGGFPQPTPAPPCEGDQCQGSPPRPPLLPDPGSASLRGARNVPPAPRFAVQPPTRAQRARLARSGRLTLTVRVNRPGRLSAHAQALLGARIRSVGRASVGLRRPGVATLTLRLARAARRQLTARGRLRLVLAIDFSRVAVGQRLSLLLRSARRER